MSVIPHNADMALALPETYLNQIANIDSMEDQHGMTYQYVRRSAVPIGVLSHEKIALKLYHMVREDMPLQPGSAESLENFIRHEIDHCHVPLRQRIGFAILGQGFLSISVWGKGNGLFVQTYSVEASFPELTRKTLEHTAVACTWDSRIMFFEIKRWHEYLLSPMRKDDKSRYLSAFISGELDAPHATL